MKLYSRQEFLLLSAGVIFAKYEPHFFGEWQIKGNTLPYNDFNYQDFVNINTDFYNEYWEACEDFVEKRTANVDFYDWRRDGLFEPNQLYAVLDGSEVRGLIARLKETLEEGYGSV